MLTSKPKNPAIAATGQFVSLSSETTRAKASVLRFSVGPSPLIQKCCDLIDEAHELVSKGFDPIAMDEHAARVYLNEFLNSEAWKEKINQWAELGVYYLKEGTKNPPKNRVCILIKRDEEGLPFYLKCFVSSLMQKSECFVDLAGYAQERERMLKHNLTYMKDIVSLVKEIDSLDKQLHQSNNATRIALMNTFNQKWLGQLEVTYTLDTQTHYGTVKVVDKAGNVISTDSSNDTFIERPPKDHKRLCPF